MSWQTYQIGDFLQRIKRPVTIESEKAYELLTIKLYHKGVLPRGAKNGRDIKAKTMYEVKEGDFILSGIDARSGAFGIVPKELDGAVVTNDFWYFSLDENIIDKEFFLELTSTNWFDEICKKGSDGTTNRIRLQKQKFFSQEINLPNTDQQKVLQQKLSAAKDLIAQVDDQNRQAKAELDNLRQSILREAVEGKLTADWRKENPDIEPASVLLEKIKEEKEALIKEGKIKKEKPLPLITEEDKPFELPEGWEWCRFGQVVRTMNNGLYKKSQFYGNTGTNMIRMFNIQSGKLDLSNIKKVIASNEEVEKYRLEESDLVLNRVNSSELIGKTAIVTDLREDAVYESMNIRIRPMIKVIISGYLNLYLAAPGSREYFQENCKQAIGQASINQTIVSNLILAFPPKNEQKAIVQKVNQLMALCDEFEEQIAQSKKEAEKLMQAVLQEVFEA